MNGLFSIGCKISILIWQLKNTAQPGKTSWEHSWSALKPMMILRPNGETWGQSMVNNGAILKVWIKLYKW